MGVLPVTWPVWLLALGPLITPYIIARVFLLPRFPGRLAFVGLFIAGVWWIGAAWAELIAQTTADKILCARFAWVGIMTAPAFWLLFVWSYVGSGRDRPPMSWMLIMAAAAVSMIVIVFTPGLQHLVYVRVTPSGPGPEATLVYTHGPVFYLATLYIYGCLAITAFLILRAAAGARGVYRRHYLAFLGAVAAPWALNAARNFMGISIEGFDPTPFCLLASGLIFFWMIAREQMFVLTPIARGKILEAVNEPMLVLDRQGLVVELNRAAAALPGLAEIRGGRLPGELAEDEPSPGHMASDLLWGDRHFEARRTPLHYYGREVGELLLLRDITARKAMEDDLRAAKAEAEHALGVQAKAMREQRNFLAMVSHEFRTPLSVIASSSQYLGVSVAGETVTREVAKIERAVARMTDLINACLASDRLDAATLLHEPEPADLAVLVERDSGEASARAEGRDIRFAAEGPVWVLCDRATLSIAVSNLIGNALKYSPATETIDVSVRQDGRMGVIEVADRGQGVDDDQRELIFERFYRAPGGEGVSGAGLGLNLVRRIVDQHFGAVEALPRAGGGAVFRIRLPALADAA